MKKNFKKSLSLFLAVLMAVSCFSIVGFAAANDAPIDITSQHNKAGCVWDRKPDVDAVGCNNGKIGAIYCKTHNNILIRSETVVPAPHNFEGVEWAINGNVTDCEKGYTRTKTCKDCKKPVLTETYNQHDWKVTGRDDAAKCTEVSYELKKCNVCKKEVREPLEPGLHSWGEDPEAGWKVKDKATCTLKGYEERKCTKCVEVETREVPATGHKMKQLDPGKEPTCEKEGSTAKWKCQNCDYQNEVFTISKLNHKDDDNNGYCDYCEGFRAEDGSICDCPCHQKSGILSSLYKIVLFIFRLFKIGQKCGCGADHYVVD